MLIVDTRFRFRTESYGTRKKHVSIGTSYLLFMAYSVLELHGNLEAEDFTRCVLTLEDSLSGDRREGGRQGKVKLGCILLALFHGAADTHKVAGIGLETRERLWGHVANGAENTHAKGLGVVSSAEVDLNFGLVFQRHSAWQRGAVANANSIHEVRGSR